MSSPLVRRKRLAAELRQLREEAKLTSEQLGRSSGVGRIKISRLENGRTRPDVAQVMDLLETLGIEGDRWHQLIKIAREASQRGWWDSYGDAMGARQRLYADLESGAATIREWHTTNIPALLQTPEYLDALVEREIVEGPLEYTPERVKEGRSRRQRILDSSDGPQYEVLLDEVLVRRRAVAPDVMRNQLLHMAKLAVEHPRIAIRVLPVDAAMLGAFLPKSAFYLYTFADPRDPALAVADTVTTDVVFSEPEEVSRYAQHYNQLRLATLSPEESVDLLVKAADRMPD